MRVARRARDLAVRLRSARALARRFGAHLLALGADRVWLFGSALDGGPFTMTSDVDVAVEGLQAEQFLAAYRDGMDSAIPVDLLDISEAHPELAERIRREGRPIVQRP
jgi:predicted nucleotidyltransferase